MISVTQLFIPSLPIYQDVSRSGSETNYSSRIRAVVAVGVWEPITRWIQWIELDIPPLCYISTSSDTYYDQFLEKKIWTKDLGLKITIALLQYVYCYMPENVINGYNLR